MLTRCLRYTHSNLTACVLLFLGQTHPVNQAAIATSLLTKDKASSKVKSEISFAFIIVYRILRCFQYQHRLHFKELDRLSKPVGPIIISRKQKMVMWTSTFTISVTQLIFHNPLNPNQLYPGSGMQSEQESNLFRPSSLTGPCNEGCYLIHHLTIFS